MTHEEQVVLITGASRGLGRSLATGFGQAGYGVALHYHKDPEGASEAAAVVTESGGEALTIQTDLTDSAGVNLLVQQVLNRWGRIDVLINNAAICRDAPVAILSEADWDAVLAADLSGPFYAMRAAAPAMASQGGGQMVNIVSVAGTRGNAGQANYAAAKAGLIGLTRSAAREWGRHNIRVNAVSPGFMDTPMTAGLPEKIRDRAVEQSCLAAVCDPEDVVIFVKALVTTRGITGQVFHLDSRPV